jgi:hypothetical protein
MPGMARSSLMLTLLGLMMALSLEAQGARTSLVVVKPGSDDAKAILQAQIVWMKTGSQTSSSSRRSSSRGTTSMHTSLRECQSPVRTQARLMPF